MAKITAERYHDFSCGHRVVGHEGKCRFLHGHNYRVHFRIAADALDNVGRVVDFSVIKERLCNWLEANWDHKFLAWSHDPVLLTMCGSIDAAGEARETFHSSVVWVPFNPTAENMARYLVEVVGPAQLKGMSVVLVAVTVEETRKCSSTYSLGGDNE